MSEVLITPARRKWPIEGLGLSPATERKLAAVIFPTHTVDLIDGHPCQKFRKHLSDTEIREIQGRLQAEGFSGMVGVIA